MSCKHDIKKTHVTFEEFDDVVLSKLAANMNYFGEENSQGRVLDFDFEYCLNCNLRLLDGKPVLTKGILDHEFERFVGYAKANNYVGSEKVTVQHSDFDLLDGLIKRALEFGGLRAGLSKGGSC